MTKRIILAAIIILAAFSLNPLFAKEEAREKQAPLKILFFHSEGCHACQKVKNEILPAAQKDFSGKIAIEYFDIADIKNYQLLISLREKYKIKRGVPVVFVGESALAGYDQIKTGLHDVVFAALGQVPGRDIALLPGINITGHFLSFGASAVLVSGLIDGINPCAFAVIVFFMSFLALQGYRKAEVFAIGLSFIAAVFLTYVLIGLGIFRFLYMLKNFYLVSRIIYYAIAGLCFILSALAVYDLFLFMRSNNTEGMFLQLPQRVKNTIHSIIGFHYRKADKQGKGDFLKLSACAFASGCAIAVLEGICTGQLYLPTVACMMKDISLRARAFAYLLLYNLMFIIPLLIVMAFALFGATSEGFARFMKRHMATVKFAMAVLFLGLGILILFAA